MGRQRLAQRPTPEKNHCLPRRFRPFVRFSDLTKIRARALALPDFATYHKTAAMEMVWLRHKDQDFDQWNRIKSLETLTYSTFSLSM